MLETDGNELCLTVTDNAVGIPAVASNERDVPVARVGPRAPARASAPARHREERASALLDELLCEAMGGHPGVRARRTTVEGPPAKVLVERSAAADPVIVASRRGLGRLALQLGRVSGPHPRPPAPCAVLR
ncbi:hypothetical protein [Streptomyces bobili]